jgi:hypothetical protein
MLSKTSRWAAAALLSLASVAANAEIIEFRFTGTITYGGNLAAIGDPITGTFSYDTDSKPRIRDKNGYANYSPLAPASMSITVGAHTVTTERLIVDIWNNFGGNVEDMVDVTSFPPTVDGELLPNGSMGFRLASAALNRGVFKTIHLPESYNVGAFDGMNYGFLQRDGAQDGTLLQFTVGSIDALDSTP